MIRPSFSSGGAERTESMEITEEEMIQDILDYIQAKIGLKLKTCDYFAGIFELAGEKYFNVIINGRVYESEDWRKLERYSHQYKTIRISPNGVERVAIYPKAWNNCDSTHTETKP